jgi:hypothetical protein
MPYFNAYEQFRSLPRTSFGPSARSPQQEIVLRIRIDDARDVGIDDDRAFLLQHFDGLGHRLRLRLVQAAARLLFTGRRDAIVVICARDADARALQSVAFKNGV